MGATPGGSAHSQHRGPSTYATPQKAPPQQTRTPQAGQTPQTPIDLTGDDPAPPVSYRKRPAAAEPYQYPTYPTTSSAAKSSQPNSAKKRKTDNPEEKRARMFRAKPPRAFHDVYSRALSQRFFVLNRQRAGTEDCPEEIVEMTGSTGNIYTIHIAKRPTCNCPHAKQGNQCKHVLYVLSRVLNAPYNLVYQLALLSSELRDIFAKAPPIASPKEAESNKRKPVEGDCPICFCELDSKSPESIVWCRAACGQNIHQECFTMWARTKSSNVTCPFCRSQWESDGDVSKVQKDKGVEDEGYVNVADQLGISRARDVSTYSEWQYGSPRRRRRPWY